MEALRRHGFFIICGLVAIGGVALGVTGLQGMPEVTAEMKKVEGIYSSLTGLQTGPVNRDRLQEEQDRIDALLSDRDQVFNKAKELYGYEPLIPDAFPNGDALKMGDFRKSFGVAMDKLYEELKSGAPAFGYEVEAMRDRIANELAEQQEIGLDPGAQQPEVITKGPTHTNAGVLTIDGAREDARARAHMTAAQRICCYAVTLQDEKPTKEASLEFPDSMRDTGGMDVPTLDEAWMAQIGLWIQTDVVHAIAAVNQKAADVLSKKGEVPWVGNLPIKDVISVRMWPEYIPQDGEEIPPQAPGGFEPAIPLGTPESVFTHSGQTGWYEVVQFSVKLIMDSRDLPQLIDEICTDSFHTLVRVAYAAVPPNREMVGKIYGSEPVVNVTMDFETTMLGEVFQPLMPEAICDYYEINCPVRAEEDGEG